MSRRSLAPSVLVALACLAPGAAAAQQSPPDSVDYRIEGIVVGAARAVTTVGGVSALEIELDSLTLPVGASVEQLFRGLPGFHVRTNSRGEAEVSVRGSESRQTAILVDGSPITMGWDARTDVSVLPADAIREMSVVRGLSSLLHGPNVLGGVVEISIARGGAQPAAPALRAGLGFDDDGGYGVSASGETPFESDRGDWLVRAGVGLRDSPGVPLPDGVVEPVPGDPASLRLNTDVHNVDGFAAVRFRGFGGGWLSLSGSAFRAERGIAGELGVAQPRLWRYPHIARGILSASAGTGPRATPLGEGGVEVNLGMDASRTEIRSYASRAYDRIVGTEDGNALTTTFRALGDHTLGARGGLRAAFTFANIDHEAIVDGTSADFRQRLFSLGSETTWRLIDRPDGAVESLQLSFGGVLDRGQTPRTGGLPSQGTIDDWGARAGLAAVARDGKLLLHGGVSRRGRFPALREAYSESLSRFVPNPDLHPERLLAMEAGATARVGDGEVQVVGFRHRLSGAIRRITLAGGRRMRVNADELRSAGAELLLSQTLGPLFVAGDLTLQSVELVDPATAAANRPENLPEVAGSLRLELPIGAGFELDGAARYTGTQFCTHPDTGADTELEGGAFIDAGLAKALTFGRPSGPFSRVEARASVDNIGDTAIYDQCGLPQSGRLLRFGIRLF